MGITHITRTLVPACLALAASVASAGDQAIAREYHFDVLLDDKPIGTHLYRVESEPGGTERVQSEAQFQVRLLGITLYRYQHRAEELWRDGCLERIDASTSDNGEVRLVQGAQTGEGFRLQKPDAVPTGRQCLAAYAYWNLPRLRGQQQLLNPQTGKLDAARLEHVGEEVLQIAGEPQRAQRYRLRAAELEIHLWYAADGRWLQLASTARGDRQLLYRSRG